MRREHKEHSVTDPGHVVVILFGVRNYSGIFLEKRYFQGMIFRLRIIIIINYIYIIVKHTFYFLY